MFCLHLTCICACFRSGDHPPHLWQDYHQTTVYTARFHCPASGFDLCERCAHDPSLGRATEASLEAMRPVRSLTADPLDNAY